MVESKSNNANKKLTDDSRCQFNYKEYTVHIFVNFTKRQYADCGAVSEILQETAEINFVNSHLQYLL